MAHEVHYCIAVHLFNFSTDNIARKTCIQKHRNYRRRYILKQYVTSLSSRYFVFLYSLTLEKLTTYINSVDMNKCLIVTSHIIFCLNYNKLRSSLSNILILENGLYRSDNLKAVRCNKERSLKTITTIYLLSYNFFYLSFPELKLCLVLSLKTHTISC